MWDSRQQGDVCLDFIEMSLQNISLLLLEIAWSHTQNTNVDLWNKKLYIFLQSSSEELVDCTEYRLMSINCSEGRVLQLPSHFCSCCHYKCFLDSDLTEKTQSLFLPRGGQIRCSSSFSSLKSWALWTGNLWKLFMVKC